MLWYVVGDVEMSFISEKRGSCTGLACDSVRLPLPLGNRSFFLNVNAAKVGFFDGGSGFAFESLVAF